MMMQAAEKFGKSWYNLYYPFRDPSEEARLALTAPPIMTGRQKRTARRKLQRQFNKKVYGY
jgi:hypothetical protein